MVLLMLEFFLVSLALQWTDKFINGVSNPLFLVLRENRCKMGFSTISGSSLSSCIPFVVSTG